MVRYPKKVQTAESLRRKFQELAKENQTGDPNCPPHVRHAKRMFQLIIKAIDGLDGESGDDDNVSDNDNNVGDDDKEDKGDAKDDEADDGGLGELVNLSFENVSDFTGEGVPSEVGTTMRRSSVTAALLSAASRGGNKRSSAPTGGGGVETKKSKAFSKPLRIPQKSPIYESNDGDGDGFTFGKVMGMMMMQNRMDNEQRERQYKSESEQREQEFQLFWEEIAIARKEAWAQRQMMSAQMQMMNAVFMAMLNKNTGDSSNPQPSPSNN